MRSNRFAVWTLTTLWGLTLALLHTESALGHSTWETYWTYGGLLDNWRTEFVGGDGAGMCSIQGMPNYWVNTATRMLVVQDTDYTYTGVGPDVAFTRTYNAPRGSGLKDPTGVFGRNWIFTYESRIDYYAQASSWEEPYVVLTRGSGQGLQYTIDLSEPAPIEGVPLEGNHDRLIWYGDYWLYWEKSTRLVYRYDGVSGAEMSRLTSVTDRDGNAVTVTYNSDGTIHSITDAAGRVTVLSYNGQKLCSSLMLSDGREATFEYDSEQHLIRSVDFNGAVSTFDYGQNGAMSSLNAAGKVATFEMDAGFMKRLTDARGNVWKFAGDWFFNQVTDPNGVAWRYSSNTEGWTGSKWNEHGTEFVRAYSAGNLTETRTLDYGSDDHRFFTYDTRGNLTQIEYKSGPGSDPNAPTIYIKYSYDENDNLRTVEDPLGNVWEYFYDDEEHLILMRSPLGNETRFAYTDRGQLSEMTDALGNRTSYSYDVFGNLTAISDEVGVIATFGYEPSGFRNVSSTDARGNVTRYTHDNNDRVITVLYPDGSTESQQFDCCSCLSNTNENGHSASFVRDSLLRPIQYLDPAGNRWSFSYDGNNNLATVTDPLGHSEKTFYDQMNRLIRVEDSLGQSVAFEYDALSNLTAVIDQNQKKISFTYFRELLKSVVDPLGNTVHYQHDLLDRVVQVTNARGGNVQAEYDAEGRLVKRSLSDGSPRVEYRYDAVGNLTGLKDSSGETAFEYNSRAQVTKILFPSSQAVAMTYDLEGNLDSHTYPGGLVVHYSYDSRNRVIRAAWGEDAVSFAYDRAGNLTRINRSNGVDTEFTYNQKDELVALSHQRDDGNLVAFAFVKDASGQTLAEFREGHLSEVYEPGMRDAVVDDANQLTDFGSATLDHDADGNLVRAGSRFSAVYDPLNRPVSITRQGVTADYVYNGLGNRTSLKSGIEERSFHYDDAGNLLFETDQDGDVTVQYVYAGGFLLARHLAGDTSFYHFDARGSTLALTDASGEATAQYAYDPFGKVAHRSGTIYNPFTFLGAYGVMDESGGLYFMKSRYYESTYQRFLQRDPLGLAGGLNRYSYAANSPVDLIDPSGLRGHHPRPQLTSGSRPGFFNNPRAGRHFDDWNQARRTGAEIAKNGVPKEENSTLAWVWWGTDKALGYHPVTGTPWGIYTGLVQLARGEKEDAFLRFMGAIPGYKQYKNIGTIYSAAADLTTLLTKLIKSIPKGGGGQGGSVCGYPGMHNPVPVYK